MTTETTAPPRLYECMFLLSQAEAADFNAAIGHLNEILSRSGCELLAMRKWDERRLAYEIDKQKRGVYILCYFTAEGDAAGRIERECGLSEHVMRVLVIRAEHMTVDQARAMDDREGLAVEAKLRAEKAEASESERRTNARLGAPEPDEKPDAEKPEEGEPAETTDESSATPGEAEGAEKAAAEKAE